MRFDVRGRWGRVHGHEFSGPGVGGGLELLRRHGDIFGAAARAGFEVRAGRRFPPRQETAWLDLVAVLAAKTEIAARTEGAWSVRGRRQEAEQVNEISLFAVRREGLADVVQWTRFGAISLRHAFSSLSSEASA